ncbi:outer membrane protein assembly factor BamE [Methylococcus capsulatus]|jgi:hypothetical protein|uniref:Lipoprotein SmpA/OmlA domain-containing protein n=2 Tax=Methylococcus capsulatus TaxID=414 RepID=A0AA35UK09_METCP|nr:outer membrane protein assembly factor BamE [Methylococcus capsulatus]CAI8874918.1 conserved exported protein of unknown function [Methylococcus capsulatus]
MNMPVRHSTAACRFALSCLAMGGLIACAPHYDSNAPALRTGYTCCKLHFEDDWISDGNYGENPFIAAGTPVKVYGYSGDRAYAEVGGRKMRLGHDYGRKEETLQQWIEKIVVTKDPKIPLAAFPPEVREAIRAGKVSEGMTKEQVILAVGYPPTSETPSLDAPVWNYWLSSFDRYQLIWDKRGRMRVSADPGVKARVVYSPGK